MSPGLKQTILDLLDYVLLDDGEHDDYLEQCELNEWDPDDIENNEHVWASAQWIRKELSKI